MRLQVLRAPVALALWASCAAVGLAATGAGAQEATPDPESAPAAPAPPPPVDDAEQLSTLRDLEAKLSAGVPLSDAERDEPARLSRQGVSPRVRALAVAVLAWLEPRTAATALLDAMKDGDARVRLVAAGSLMAVVRRVDEEQKREVLATALRVLDDPSDEVACAAAELVQAASPSAAPDALRDRAEHASDVRYACYARIAGLPVRSVKVPPLPVAEPPTPDDGAAAPAEMPTPEAPAAPPSGKWLWVVVGASGGALAGGLLPGALVPSRDVLTYAPGRTRLVHEEVAFGTQAAGAVVGGLVGGGSAFGLSLLAEPGMDQATSALLATGAGALMGASAQLAFGLGETPAVLAFAGGTAGGLLVGGALAMLTTPTFNDHALSLSLAGAGALLGALTVFTAVPVGFDTVGGAYRTDFGIGVAGLGAGALGVLGLAAGTLLEVPARRSAAAVASGLIGVGVVGGAAFLFIPQDLDVKSRVASGSALAGGVIAAVVGAVLLPDSLFSTSPAGGAALHLQLDAPSGMRLVRLGVPAVVPWQDARGGGVATSLLSGAF